MRKDNIFQSLANIFLEADDLLQVILLLRPSIERLQDLTYLSYSFSSISKLHYQNSSANYSQIILEFPVKLLVWWALHRLVVVMEGMSCGADLSLLVERDTGCCRKIVFSR